ncbi:MAG: M20 family metallopeptidase [Acetobacterales bacterium]
MSGTRDGAIARAHRYFDDGSFVAELSRRVAIPSVSQEPDKRPALDLYVDEEMTGSLEALGFECAKHPNPHEDSGPILVARRIEDESLPTVLTYGHGDVVRGLESGWSQGLDPWTVTRKGDRLYGRGTADNKGQHTVNLAALDAVIKERGGSLGFNVVFVLEMMEERGSRGLREFCDANRDLLAADVMIASDGPRLSPKHANMFLGSRGGFNFRLDVKLREGGHHSGHWGGVLEDPEIILSHAIASIVDRRGRILIPEWVPKQIPPLIREMLKDVEIDSGDEAPDFPEDWGEPGLSQAEKMLAWTSFIVLASQNGNPDNPVNAVSDVASAWCQLRHTSDVDAGRFEPALREHLDANGFQMVSIEADQRRRRRASRTDPANPWVGWARESMQRTVGGNVVHVAPNQSGGLPNDVFEDMGMPTLWFPHSYNGCSQHAPNEHMLASIAREGLGVMAGLFWDLAENPPKS